MSIELLGIAESELAASGAIATAREITQQPRMLAQTHALVAQLQTRLDGFAGHITGNAAARVILTGAGTSAYIGECLAPLLDRRLSARVDAVPTTDLVSSPLLHLDPGQPLLLVSFGRSGNSPESLAAVELAESLVREVRHLVVTCNPQGGLARIAVREAMVLQLPEETHDASFAMTSSFTCMMYATLAALAGSGSLGPRIAAIAAAMAQVIDAAPSQVSALVSGGFTRVVYLGAGPFKGLAREACLKLGELTNGAVATCFDSPLGFRHGPKTFIDAGTLVLVFVSNDPHARRYDHDLIDELRQDACAARVIEIASQPREAALQDTLVVPGVADAADVELLWPYAAIAQAYAFYASRALGLTPDNPNAQGTVNRVVQGVRIHPFPG
ncbi:SIS domain-containing protein [Luteimonas composti]|uniref:SIS domain-containing protein n=1 Tax=Luteimonas composti TaxID=398257 RepID=A0ABT6MT69_9GAMM|nr:SIS domain-containing protein [Luteimonas composti]MDH7453795.1 SIS domain-containing protein [Luteimonas composti]